MNEQPQPPVQACGEAVIIPLPATCKEISEQQDLYVQQYGGPPASWMCGTGLPSTRNYQIDQEHPLSFSEWYHIVGLNLSEENVLLLTPAAMEDWDLHQDEFLWVRPVSGWLCIAQYPDVD